jgi:hypothetical protein
MTDLDPWRESAIQAPLQTPDGQTRKEELKGTRSRSADGRGLGPLAGELVDDA